MLLYRRDDPDATATRREASDEATCLIQFACHAQKYQPWTQQAQGLEPGLAAGDEDRRGLVQPGHLVEVRGHALSDDDDGAICSWLHGQPPRSGRDQGADAPCTACATRCRREGQVAQGAPPSILAVLLLVRVASSGWPGHAFPRAPNHPVDLRISRYVHANKHVAHVGSRQSGLVHFVPAGAACCSRSCRRQSVGFVRCLRIWKLRAGPAPCAAVHLVPRVAQHPMRSFRKNSRIWLRNGARSDVGAEFLLDRPRASAIVHQRCSGISARRVPGILSRLHFAPAKPIARRVFARSCEAGRPEPCR